MADIFLSYVNDDLVVVAQIARLLEERGLDVWWDRKIRVGQAYSDEIENQIQGARKVVVVWSQRSVLSSWVRDEAGEALRLKKLVPLSIDGSLPPMGFRQIQTVGISEYKQAGGTIAVEPLVTALCEHLEHEDVVDPAEVSRTTSFRRAQRSAFVMPDARTSAPRSDWAIGVKTLVTALVVIAVTALGAATYVMWQTRVFEPLPFDQAARPSFVCSNYKLVPKSDRARIPQSDILCHHEGAATADKGMAAAYYRLEQLLTGVELAVLRSGQRDWVKGRNKSCPATWTDVESPERVSEFAACLTREAQLRLKVLDEQLAKIGK